MKRRRTFTAVGALALGCALAVAVGIYHYSTGSGQASYALSVNGQHFAPGDVATRVAQAQTLATAESGDAGVAGSPNVDLSEAAVIKTLILEAVQHQEAQRRGLSCTQAEASASEATQVAEAVQVSSVGENQVLALAASFGLVPADYLQTPEAERTPASQGAVAAYLASPQLAAATLHDCETGKLYAQIRQLAKAKGEDSVQAEQDLHATVQQLIGQANVGGPALTPSATPMPTATAAP